MELTSIGATPVDDQILGSPLGMSQLLNEQALALQKDNGEGPSGSREIASTPEPGPAPTPPTLPFVSLGTFSERLGQPLIRDHHQKN